VLHDADHAGRHEPGGAHGLARASDLGDLRDTSGGGHLDPPARLRSHDVELTYATAHVDEDLDPVTLHAYERRTRRSERMWMGEVADTDRVSAAVCEEDAASTH
jgi:hypothetical protein